MQTGAVQNKSQQFKEQLELIVDDYINEADNISAENFYPTARAIATKVEILRHLGE